MKDIRMRKEHKALKKNVVEQKLKAKSKRQQQKNKK